MTPDYLSDDELEKLAPGLSKLKKENPFRVPDNYFDSLAGNIQKKIDSLPDLEKIKKENPFSVPEGYFDSLPTIIQQRIVAEKNRTTVFGEWISIVLRPKVAFAMAAVIVLLIFGIKFLAKTAVNDTQDNFLSCEDVKNSAYFTDLDESILVDVLESEQNKNSGVKEDNSMEQYLMDNDIDISQLENRL